MTYQTTRTPATKRELVNATLEQMGTSLTWGRDDPDPVNPFSGTKTQNWANTSSGYVGEVMPTLGAADDLSAAAAEVTQNALETWAAETGNDVLDRDKIGAAYAICSRFAFTELVETAVGRAEGQIETARNEWEASTWENLGWDIVWTDGRTAQVKMARSPGRAAKKSKKDADDLIWVRKVGPDEDEIEYDEVG